MAINPINYNGGGDVVLNGYFGGIANAFNRNQARIAKQQQDQADLLAKQQKELNDLVKEVNTNGVQKVDVDEVNSLLNNVYDTYYKANRSQNREERLKLRMDLERQINDIGQFVSLSKERGAQQLKRAEWIGDPRNTGLVSSDAQNRFKQYSNVPTSKLPPNAFDIGNYSQLDTSYVDNEDSQLVNRLWTNAGTNTENVINRTLGRERFGERVATRAITQDEIGVGLNYNYNNNDRYRNIVNAQATGLGLTPQQFLLQKAEGLAKVNTPKISREPYREVIPAPSRSSGGGGSGSATNVGSVMSINIPFADGRGNVQFDEYVPVSIPAKNFAGSQAIDLTTGKNISNDLPSSEKYSVVGIGNVPTLTGMRDKNLNGGISQPDFARNNPNNIIYKPIVHVKLDEAGYSTDYFIPLDRLPLNIKNSKAIKEATNQFQPAKPQTRATQPTQRRTRQTGKKSIAGF